ncbi:MAG: DUF3500 domain-containing protein [Pirellulales bacterium]|nr:DUF3500 domain-containing protein [Pirellulales bacterium]
MTEAAQQFLSSLDDAGKAKAQAPFDDQRRVAWHFIPMPTRKGLQIKEMADAQRKAAHALLSAALSEAGYGKAQTIMELESILRALEHDRKDSPIRDPERYYFTIFGEPGLESKWGLSVEGHHLSLNFVVDKNRIVSHTPAFFGANPAVVQAEVGVGPKRGTRVLAQEELLAFELINSLGDDSRKQAIIGEKAPHDLRAAGEPQPPQTAPEGISAANLSVEQQETLRKLIAAYAANMPQAVAAARIEEIGNAGFEKIHFAWAGALQPGIGHYYRVQGPTFLIEFVNTQPDSAGNPANHIHSVWRDMQGDFAIPIGHDHKQDAEKP